MSSYFASVAEFKARSIIPPTDVDRVEAIRAGFTLARSAVWSSYINSRLQKRYLVPFASPVPETILGWLSALVSLDVMRARGVNPQDPQAELLKGDRDNALAEIKEAADAKDGLFELPVREDIATSAVAFGSPLGYSETSPYVWTDVERSNGRNDDRNGAGR